MDDLTKIICGVDFSDNSKCALRQATRIAKWNGAEVVAVHILDRRLLDFIPLEVKTEFEASAAKRLDELVFEVVGDASKVRKDVFFGHPFRSLSDLISSENADLLVLGVNGHGTEAGQGRPAGTIAKKCVRKVPAKVLLVRGDQAGAYRNIVHCTDFSETASLAFEQAIATARAEESPLEVIHSMIGAESMFYGAADARLYDYINPDVIRKAVERDMANYVDNFATKLKGIEIKTTIVEARKYSESRTLVEAIIESGADLVVLGTHGRGAIAGLLMGTTAEKIVSHAPCSILAVKPEGFKVFW